MVLLFNLFIIFMFLYNKLENKLLKNKQGEKLKLKKELFRKEEQK